MCIYKYNCMYVYIYIAITNDIPYPSHRIQAALPRQFSAAPFRSPPGMQPQSHGRPQPPSRGV